METTKKIVKKTSAAAPKSKLSPQGRGSVKNPPHDGQLLEIFSTNVRIVRKIKGLSQEALADLCDLDRTYLSSLERKLRNVSIRNIQRIADALQVDARILLDPELASGKATPSGNLLLPLVR